MKKFLQKYLTAEQLSEIEKKYLEERPEAKGLPEYISKTRLDEVLTKQRNAEGEVESLRKTVENLGKEKEAAIAEALKKANDELVTKHAEEIKGLKRNYEISEAIHKAHGRNVNAIKALIDPTKDFNEEITRLQKDESYLFGPIGDVPPGTGKDGATSGGTDEVTAAMRRAVGLQ